MALGHEKTEGSAAGKNGPEGGGDPAGRRFPHHGHTGEARRQPRARKKKVFDGMEPGAGGLGCPTRQYAWGGGIQNITAAMAPVATSTTTSTTDTTA